MTATRHRVPILLLAILAMPLPAASAARRLPDSLEMKDDTSLRGLILKNSAKSVLIQTETSEVEIPKSEIRRIRDNPDPEIVYDKVTRKGQLPAWRAMVMDMREHDSIHSFQQIPATAIDAGIFKNIPYLSFRVNRQAEFNVYGDPNNPVGLEFGIYGRKKNSAKYQRIIREFLAGHLDSRREIGALYSISLRGGKQQVGPLIFEITPPKHADAYGGWWISIYDPGRAEAARVSDADYDAITRPFEQIVRRNGSLRQRDMAKEKSWLAATMESLTGAIPQIRGFYRDKDGVFHALHFGDGSNPQ